MNQSAESVPAQDTHAGHVTRWIHVSCGRILVRPMAVIMIGVFAQDQPHVPLAGDQHPVQAFAAATGDPAFRESVRSGRLDRSPDDPHASCDEDRVERGGEFGVPVLDQELQIYGVILEGHHEVAGLPGHPLPLSGGR
jgi:hypothetical protein